MRSPAAINSSPRRTGLANQAPAIMPAHSVRMSSRPWACSARWSIKGLSSGRLAVSNAYLCRAEPRVWSAVDILSVWNVGRPSRSLAACCRSADGCCRSWWPGGSSTAARLSLWHSTWSNDEVPNNITVDGVMGRFIPCREEDVLISSTSIRFWRTKILAAELSDAVGVDRAAVRKRLRQL
jgi:hypothetical protein